MKTKTPVRKPRRRPAQPVVVIDGITIRLLRHPGKGKIPLQDIRKAVREVKAMRAAGIDPDTVD